MDLDPSLKKREQTVHRGKAIIERESVTLQAKTTFYAKGQLIYNNNSYTYTKSKTDIFSFKMTKFDVRF